MNFSQRSTLPRALAAFALAAASFAVPAFAADSATTFTITAVGKKNAAPPELKRDDLQLRAGKERLQIADLRREENLRLAILIDDSLDASVANQWSDLKQFILDQPSTTYIAVAYARNGSAAIAQDFTNNHELATKALRIPMGSAGAIASPYLAVLDFLKRWPSPGGRNSLLFLSSGIDYFRGGFGLQNPDVDSAISRAEKENINIWTIYAPDNFHRGRGFFRVNNAQSLLSKLSEQTGAESYYLGFGAPVNLKPYFDEIGEHLRNQYLLSFRGGDGGKKGKFQSVRVHTETPNLEFMTFDQVFVPPAQ
jgi:VWFA-related protein